MSLALLPEVPMAGRAADRRVGFFTTAYVDVGTHSEASRPDLPSQYSRVNPEVRLISRWRLTPGQDGGIVYHVDPSVPQRWRQYVKRGIELWQPAFAALGYTNTPRAVLPGDADWPSDYAAGDIRYASVGFALSEDRVFAIGPSVVDPRSGEIIDADIGFAQEWVRYFTAEVGTEAPGSGGGRRRGAAGGACSVGDGGAAGSSSSGGGDRGGSLRASRHATASSSPPPHSSIHSRHDCARARVAAGEGDAMAALSALLGAGGGGGGGGESEVSPEVVGDALAGVTVHEVGHTLGLRHNFKGSSAIPFSKIFDKTYTSVHSSSSSVMDYIGPVVAPTAEQQATTLVFPDGHSVGAYDTIAIAYGYTQLAGGEGGEAAAAGGAGVVAQGAQSAELAAIAARVAEQGLE